MHDGGGEARQPSSHWDVQAKVRRPLLARCAQPSCSAGWQPQQPSSIDCDHTVGTLPMCVLYAIEILLPHAIPVHGPEPGVLGPADHAAMPPQVLKLSGRTLWALGGPRVAVRGNEALPDPDGWT